MNIALYVDSLQIMVGLFDEINEVKRVTIPYFIKDDENIIANKILQLLEVETCEKVICPGGIVKPLHRGIYKICNNVINDLDDTFGQHEYNKLTKVCVVLAKLLGAQPLMIDPMSCDELTILNKVTGHYKVKKQSRYYACDHSAAMDLAASRLNSAPEEVNFIICKIDDDVSIGAHLKGKCIDVNDVIGGEGPMGFRNSGDLPVAQLAARLIKDEKKFEDTVNQLSHQSGVFAYLGTDDPIEIDERIKKGDKDADLIARSMAYQIAKWIGSSTLNLRGKVDAIVLIGKGVQSEYIMEHLKKRVMNIAPILIETLDMVDYLGKAASIAGKPIYPINNY